MPKRHIKKVPHLTKKMYKVLFGMKHFSIHGQFSAAAFVPALKTKFLMKRKILTINSDVTEAETFADSER